MYAGRVAEIGPVHDVINQPSHPYTSGLMHCIPDMSQDRETLHQIDGSMPRLNAIPTGCAFNPRCPHAVEQCRQSRPELMAARATQSACWFNDRTATRSEVSA
jgi:peptide/nickel transport system ATP-binding protein